MFSSIASAVAADVMVGATSSRLLISKVTDCAALALPAASVAITAKLYWLCTSKSGSVLSVTSPVVASMLSAASLPAARLKLTPSLTSAESSAVAV